MLTRLLELSEQDVHGRAPTVPDVPPLKLKPKKVHTFSRSVARGTLTGSATLDQIGSLQFQLTDVPAYAEITALFDQYRIIQVQIDFIPVLSNPAQALPLSSSIDYDDAAVPSSLDQIREYDTYSESQYGIVHRRTINPRLAMAAYSGSVFTSFANMGQVWLDAGSPGVPYYGLKYVLPAGMSVTTSPAYRIEARYIVQARSVH